MERGACRPQSRGSQRARQDWVINTYSFLNSLMAIVKVVQLEWQDKEDWDKVLNSFFVICLIQTLFGNDCWNLVDFWGGLVVNSLLADSGDPGDVVLIPGSGSFPGGGNGNSLQYSYLKNPMDRGTWWFTVYGVAKSQIQLNGWAQHSTLESVHEGGKKNRRIRVLGHSPNKSESGITGKAY